MVFFFLAFFFNIILNLLRAFFRVKQHLLLVISSVLMVMYKTAGECTV